VKKLILLPIVAAMAAFAPTDGLTAEPYEEPYWETKNPVRIFDWDTLKLLLSTKVEKVRIKADSPEKLIAQLDAACRGVKGAENIRFAFNRPLWERPLSDGTTGTIRVTVELGPLENVDLLTLIRYVSELNGMTFSVKKNEIVFRPLIG